jgi:uncharacterized membrane protein
MPALRIPSDTVSSLGRAAHDAGLAALLGGNLFGRVALHPALADVSDPAERGKVVNRAWRRYGWVNSAGLLAVVGGWAGARVNEAAPASLSARERRLALAKDASVAAVALTGVAAAITGMRFAKTAANGAVPLTDGSHPGPETPDDAARLKRTLNVLSAAGGLAELSLVATNAALGQANFRRPPVRRVLRRSY